MLDEAFEALKTYYWGDDLEEIKPIEDAIVSTHGDCEARSELENRLVAVLAIDVSRAAKEFVCRQLRTIGTAASVTTLAAMLEDPDHSHMARYALERIPGAEAGTALRHALRHLESPLKIGVISSLGTRQEIESVDALAELLGDDDAAVASAAACALGAIRSPQAAAALASRDVPHGKISAAVADSLLSCAEGFLSDGNKTEALGIYKGLANSKVNHVRLAAARGMLACAGA